MISPNMFSFSPFEYMKMLRESKLKTLDPRDFVQMTKRTEIVDKNPCSIALRRQSIVAEYSIYNDLKLLTETLPQQEQLEILHKYGQEQGGRDLKQDFSLFLQDLRQRAIKHHAVSKSPISEKEISSLEQ